MEVDNSESKSFLIGGVVRNCEKALKSDVLYLQNALKNHPNKQWLLIESDSDDKTIEVLRELESVVKNFHFITLGALSNNIPERTQRIAYCRNKYLEEFESNPLYRGFDYMLVSDFDGMNNCITEKAIKSCWDNADWDVATANQWGPYYDIFALRHPLWSPNNCWDAQRFLATQGFNENHSKYIGVYSRMVTVPELGPWIEVDSAFGGMAIYKREKIQGLRYTGATDHGEEISEHVPFHAQVKARGGRIFINPKLINTKITEHCAEYLAWKEQYGF